MKFYRTQQVPWIAVLAVACVVSAGVVQGVRAAWQNPTCDPNTNPDTCNAAAPINVSSSAQTKNGPLTVSVNTGVTAFTINSGGAGSPVALAINAGGTGVGVNIANAGTGGALNINSIGAVIASTIIQNQSGGTGLSVSVNGATGGTAVFGSATTGTTGSGLSGTGSRVGVQGMGSGDGVGVFGQGAGTGSGVIGQIVAGGTGIAGYFDGASSGKALATVSGQVSMTSAIANTPTLVVTTTAGGGTGPSAITASNSGTASPAIYGVGTNAYGLSGSTQAYNYAGVIGCYGASVNCGMLGTGALAGYFNGGVVVEQNLQVNGISASDTIQETQTQGQIGDNTFTSSYTISTTNPGAMESSGDYVWLCNRSAPYQVVKMRPSDLHLVGVINLPANFVCSDMVFDGQYIWVSSDGALTGVERIDSFTNVANFYAVGAIIRGLTFDSGNIWATGSNTNQLFKINRASGAISNTYPTLAGGAPFGIVYANGKIWWTNTNLVGGKYYVSKINTDGTGMTHYIINAQAPQRLAFDGDALWIPSTNGSAILSRFDVVNSIEKFTYTLPEATGDIVFDQNFLWITAPTTRRLYVVRPLDGTLMNTFNVSSASGNGNLVRLFFDGHAVWYSMSTDNNIGRYTVPWGDGYANGSTMNGVSLYDTASNTYTCVTSDGAGGIKTSAGLCP